MMALNRAVDAQLLKSSATEACAEPLPAIEPAATGIWVSNTGEHAVPEVSVRVSEFHDTAATGFDEVLFIVSVHTRPLDGPDFDKDPPNDDGGMGEQAVSPACVVVVPAEHARHAWPPAVFRYCPAGHSVQADIPFIELKLPGAHTVHEVALSAALNVPGGHGAGPELWFGQ